MGEFLKIMDSDDWMALLRIKGLINLSNIEKVELKNYVKGLSDSALVNFADKFNTLENMSLVFFEFVEWLFLDEREISIKITNKLIFISRCNEDNIGGEVDLLLSN
nr:hypothetical protein [Candidatus Gracilibacteria bacterium]